MFIIDITAPLILILILIATVSLIFLAREVKKSYIASIPLFAHLILLILHTTQMATLSEEFKYLTTTLSMCLTIDFLFILMTFFAYLWVDDIEATAKNKKSIDNSLDWFWKNV